VPSWWVRSDGQTKTNFRRLAERYFAGTNLGTAENGLPDSLPDATWGLIASNVVAYQKTRIAEEGGPLLALIPDVDQPANIFAPYLLARDSGEDRVNAILLHAAAESAQERVVAHIAVPVERFSRGVHLDRILSVLSSDMALGCFLWIERLPETTLVGSDVYLDTLEWMLDRLAEKGLLVWHANGGYCAAAMRDWGMTGIAHSLAWRDHGMPAAPPTGIPRHSRYTYVTGLHYARSFDDAMLLGRSLDSETYQRLYCGCSFCLGAWEADQHPLNLMLQVTAVKGPRGRTDYIPSEQALAANTLHFMWARRGEVLDLSQAPIVDVLMREIDRGVELKGEAANLRRLVSRLRPAS